MALTINYYAAAKAAVGHGSEQLDHADLPRDDDGRVTRGAVENALIAAHPEAPTGQQPLVEVLPRCSFLLDGQACPEPDQQIPDGSALDVLPPFAGG
ncbi:MoaD/ThiS family protein [Kocuria palustris]|uniref:MoaD/ThiS family protein n=1 Tax=Kocuria palustris TaxID=71999 RepID=UPI0011A09926|nr:MoaD/ThiS family protein [Kocuria palustris]